MSEIIVRLKDNRIKITGGEYVRDLVRCKDCKHWHDNTEFCDFWSALNVAQRTIKTDYCSYGEKEDK